MLTFKESANRLSLAYRPGVLGVIGGPLAALGAVIVCFALAMHHTVTLTCEGPRAQTCVLERISVIGSERTEVKNLRGATAEQELVLHADPDLVMGRWVSRRVVPSYRDAVVTIDAYVSSSQARLDVSVPDRATLRWWGVGLVLLVIGGGLVTLFAIGARITLDRTTNELQLGKRRVPLGDLIGFEVRGNTIVGQLRDAGEVAIVSTLGGRKGARPMPRPDLETAAERLRRFVAA